MAFSLRKIFEFVGSFALIAPHDGHETELLLNGHKPIGMICTINLPVGDRDPDMLRDLENVAKLDAAVEAGKLSKILIPIRELPEWQGRNGAGHFYCQPGLEADLKDVAEFHKTCWEGRGREATLPKDTGLYFGFTEADVELFHQGGYSAKVPVVRFLLKSTHSWRKAARLAAMQSVDLTQKL